MSVRLDNFVMMAMPVPKHVFEQDVFFDQFSDIFLNNVKKPVGQLGILYDGMSLEYCYYGAVLAFRSGYSDLIMPPMSARQFGQASGLVFEGWCKMPWFEEWCKTPWTTGDAASPRLHFVNHWY